MNALLFSLLFALQSTVSAGTGAITGRLLTISGNPAANMRVALSPGDSGALVSLTLTDNAGRYRIANVPPGRYYIAAGLVDSPTYLPGTVSRKDATQVSVTAGSLVEAPDFRLAANSGGLRLRGRVIREWIPVGQAAPPLTIRVSLLRQPSIGTLTTVFADGSFEVSGLSPGQYSLFVQNVDNASLTEPFVLTDRDLEDFQVTIPASAVRTTVTGTVKIDGIAPIPAIQLVLTDTAAKRERRWGLVENIITMPAVLVGEYSVSLADLPEGYSIKAITAGSTNLLVEKLRIAPASEPPQLTITLGVSSPPPWVKVLGHLTDKDGVLLPTAISLNTGYPGSTLIAAVQADGAFEIPMLLPGTYNVQLQPPVDAFVRTITVGKENPTVVEVPLKIVSFKVSGTITGADRLPAGYSFAATLRASSERSSGPPVRVLEGAHGTFEFTSVQPGSYVLTLSRTCADCNLRTVNLNATLSIVVTDKDITGLVIQGR
jgi:hypothetical protein